MGQRGHLCNTRPIVSQAQLTQFGEDKFSVIGSRLAEERPSVEGCIAAAEVTEGTDCRAMLPTLANRACDFETQTREFARQTPSFAFQTTDFEIQTPSFESQTPSFESQTTDFGNQTRDFETQTKSFQNQTREFESQTTEFGKQTTSVWNQTTEFAFQTTEFENETPSFGSQTTLDGSPERAASAQFGYSSFLRSHKSTSAHRGLRKAEPKVESGAPRLEANRARAVQRRGRA